MGRRKRKQAMIGTVMVLFIITILVLAVVIKKYAPSTKMLDLKDYYGNQKNELAVVLQDQIAETKGLYLDGQAYIEYATVKKELDQRFYWDTKENLLIYTTPTEVIKAEGGSKDYYINKSKKSVDYPITKVNGDKVYIAVDFIKKYSDIKTKLYKDPNRIVVQYKWGDALYAKVRKKTQLRNNPWIKSSILVKLKEDQVVMFVDSGESTENGFSKVITKDGVVGYVKTNYVKNTYYKTLASEFKGPEYTSIHKDYKINLVWHQVTNQTANNNLLYMLEGAKGVNTISPTWFSISSNDGEVSSLASERYVERAHGLGLEVWGLVDDFNPDVDMLTVLSSTTSREKLINTLIANAIQYNLDGLNIDFENIALETGVHYIEFIRELSVKCRNNGIVLSVDNYVPTSYSAYYNRGEQGAVADYVITMAYDETHGGSKTSGSVASFEFVKAGVENTLKEVPKEKVIIGIPFFTRLWKEVGSGDSAKVSSQSYGMNEQTDVLNRNGAKAKWDATSKQNYAEFKDGDTTFKMWLEDETSLEEKLKVISDNDVAGVAGWKLGLEEDYVWNLIAKYMN